MASSISSLLIIILLLHSMACVISNTTVCKLENCIHNLDEILSLKQGDEDILCLKIIKTVQCFQNCLQPSLLDETDLGKDFPSFYSQVCRMGEIDDILGNGQCILKHLYELIACFVDSINLYSSDKYVTTNTTACRRVLAIESCPKEVLHSTCKLPVAEAIESLMYPLLKSSRESNCYFVPMNALNLEVTSPFGNRLKKLARCFSRNNKVVVRCFEKFQSKNSETSLQCKHPKFLVDCIEPLLGSVCDRETVSASFDFFHSVMKFFDNSSCSHNTISIAPTKPETEISSTLMSAGTFRSDTRKTQGDTSAYEKDEMESSFATTIKDKPKTSLINNDQVKSTEFDAIRPPRNISTTLSEPALNDVPDKVTNTQSQMESTNHAWCIKNNIFIFSNIILLCFSTTYM